VVQNVSILSSYCFKAKVNHSFVLVHNSVFRAVLALFMCILYNYIIINFNKICGYCA
jgi:hypothetical protein